MLTPPVSWLPWDKQLCPVTVSPSWHSASLQVPYHRASQPWTKASEIASPNKSFFLNNCFSQTFVTVSKSLMQTHTHHAHTPLSPTICRVLSALPGSRVIQTHNSPPISVLETDGHEESISSVPHPPHLQGPCPLFWRNECVTDKPRRISTDRSCWVPYAVT